MRKIEKKINRFLKKYQNTMTFSSIPLIILGIIFSRVEGMGVYMVLSYIAATILCGFPIAFRAYLALKVRTVSIELLVSIAVIGALVIKEFSECAVVTFLFQFGNYLELQTLKRTRGAIKSLVENAPQTAFKKENEEITEIDVSEIQVSDTLLVKSGGKVAVDGIISSNEGYFNESSITGESKLVHKRAGDFVYAGSILDSGLVEMTASRVGEDTTYAKIIALVEEAQDAKSPVERFIDRFAKYYTPLVIIMAFIALLITRDVDTSVTVLVLACPGALVIGAPVANVSGIGRGAKDGILFKGGDVIHTFSKSTAFLFDKTGTLTYGNASVATFHSYVDDYERYLRISANMENKGTHPLGKAIIAYARENNIDLNLDLNIEVAKGAGILSSVEDEVVYVGNEKLLADHGIVLDQEQIKDISEIKANGESLVLVGGKDGLYLCFGISDTVRHGAVAAIQKLKKQKIDDLVMLTGDNAETAGKVGSRLGLSKVYANLLPEEKFAILEQYQRDNKKICFVGDGINDSPALTKADTGIAMGNGTDIAIECSDIVILNSDIEMVPKALQLSKKIVLVTMENIFISVFTVALLLAGLFLNYIHMSSGMLIHEASILVVIFNAMRLLIKRKDEK